MVLPLLLCVTRPSSSDAKLRARLAVEVNRLSRAKFVNGLHKIANLLHTL